MMIQHVIAATKNAGKIREIKAILGPEAEVVTMSDAGFTDEIEETGQTFEENALIKARAVYEAMKGKRPFDLVISDDSGIEIDFFDKKPGIYSSRWLGEDTPYDVKNQIVLDRLAGVPHEKRSARYVCSIACVLKDGESLVLTETAEGFIAESPSGEGGFGYDPIFEFPGLGTFADLSPEQKNAVSHRGKALRAVERELKERGLI